MTGGYWGWITFGALGLVLLMLIEWRGVRINKINVWLVEFELEKPVVVGPLPWLRIPLTLAVLVLVGLCVILVFGINVPGQDILNPGSSARTSYPMGAQFRDCNNGCPLMIVLGQNAFSSGQPNQPFVMGSDDGASDELPAHKVTISYRLAVGVYPVTRAEYAVFAQDTDKSANDFCWRVGSDGQNVEPGTGGPSAHLLVEQDANFRNPQFQNHPAVCVSWTDAEEYVEWLSKRTGEPYRLLSEAEWEYVARGGSTSALYYDGTDPRSHCKYVNSADLSYAKAHPEDQTVNSTCSDGYAFTSPVGTFPPNHFRVFDIMGNVTEWTADCYHPTYYGAPIDGSPWGESSPTGAAWPWPLAIDGNPRAHSACENRVARGGNWADNPSKFRSALRMPGDVTQRYIENGFRVARLD